MTRSETGSAPRAPWRVAASRRRAILSALVFVPTLFAAAYMADALPQKGGTWLELAIVLVFAALFAWISVGFWAAMAGALILLRGRDRYDVRRMAGKASAAGGDAAGRVAVLVPVANEEPGRVFAGIKATIRSLERTGEEGRFDVFVLSDSGDPDAWVEEELAWAETCEELGAWGRLYYRRRRVNLKRKSGNVADFCRRFGRKYRYMVVFDADSVMSGEALTTLVRLMEARPGAGMIQTAPVTQGRETLHARVQQFSGRLYGPMFAAGLHFWQLGDSQFWGHNAIIRTERFMRHCSLPRLPGSPPLGGDIMSHDFVEAALMRRAGYEVWLAWDLPGSWEEPPPTLLNELKRDRRWCQGNLQHMRLLFTRGLFPAHRALFLNGAMAYVSALLWFCFLVLSTVEALVVALTEPVYFTGRGLFPEWPVWRPQWALTLLAATAVILFLPKLASAALAMPRAGRFGGGGRLLGSVLAETILSTLLAPVRMLFHSKFVFFTLLGQQSGWGAQQRGDEATPWSEAFRFHWPGLAIGLVWGGALYLYNRPFFWWNIPIIVSLLLCVPLSVLTSRADLGRASRRAGLFLTPEEISPGRELAEVRGEERREEVRHDAGTVARRGSPQHAPDAQRQGAIAAAVADPLASLPGFVRAVTDPRVNGLHLALLRRPRRFAPAIQARREALRDKALAVGPAGLTAREKKELLADPVRLAELHCLVWELEPEAAARWGVA